MKKILLIGLSLCLFLMACSKKEAFLSTDITGSALGGELNLPDFNGQVRQLSDFKGKVIVLFFGYTHCPDICPTTLSEMAAAMKRLGKHEKNVQVIFVSVDPARDTPDLLAQYVPAFNPSFLALRGSEEATQAIAKRFKVFYQKNDEDPYYTIDHSSGTFIFDKEGKLRLLANYGAGEKVLAHDIQLLLNE
jgi:protein SCO1/2